MWGRMPYKSESSQLVCSICKTALARDEASGRPIYCSCKLVTELKENMWIVVGHYGDDTSYIEVVIAENEELARERFAEFMDAQSEGSELWITGTSRLKQAVEHRLGG